MIELFNMEIQFNQLLVLNPVTLTYPKRKQNHAHFN